MLQVDESAWVPFSASQMFNLVNDIKSYPDFLPWCKNTEIIKDSDNTIEAKVDFYKSGFSKSFTTLNTIEHNKSIKMSLVNGPFKHLSGEWIFTEVGEGASNIALKLEFEVNVSILSKALGPVFKQMTQSMVGAFMNRANEIYEN